MTSLRAAVGIPTARNVDHYAFTVPNLAQAVEFFVDVLGGEVAYRLGPISAPATDPDWMSRHLAVDRDASTIIAMLRLGPVSNVELFEYDAVGQVRSVPAAHRPGGHHLAFAVSDLDVALSYLRSRSLVRDIGPVEVAPPGSPEAGERRVGFRSAWGMRFALRQAPPGSAERLGRFSPVSCWSNTVQPGRDPADEPSPVGIPTATNVDHVAYTVPDLDAASSFLVDVLGARHLYDVPGKRRSRRWFRLGPTANVELSQHVLTRPDQRRPRNSDVGGHHLAFWVEDLDAAVEYLASQQGVRVLGDPLSVKAGPLGGGRWVYFTTPFGMTMETLTFVDGQLPYEAETSVRRRSREAAWDSGVHEVARIGHYV
jgi:catechol 2,3-dioxygenase-like lactoylglutathione lyase family enzyme